MPNTVFVQTGPVSALTVFTADVNANGYGLTNLATITGAGGALGVAVSSAAVNSFDTNGFRVYSTDAYAIDKGAQIRLGGHNGSGGSQEIYTFATIAGRKENGTVGDYNGYLQFVTNAIGALYERMRITAFGNVGIGTISPSYLLDVGNLSSAANQTVRVAAGAGYDASLLLKEASDGYGFEIRNIHGAGLIISRCNGGAAVNALYIERATGQLYHTVPNAAATDASLWNSSAAVWYDEGGSRLVFRVRSSAGVLKTGYVNVS